MVQTPEPHTYELPAAAPFSNHGRTKAAWVLMWGVCLGFLAAGVGLIVGSNIVVIAGAAVVVVAIVLSVVMRGMGLGQPAARGPEETADRDWYSA
ncbi:HGxxPAAW family protein [Georgenia sp. SUBG003]|uniref:HGxxPAAW family protein n=1 Tax=Georgenia sp. SUBG003 TaxID=1497974 RepID=UPI0006948DF2